MTLYCVINLEDSEPFIVTICNKREKAEELIERYKSNYADSGDSVPEFDICEFDSDTDYEGGIVFNIYRDYWND